MQLEPTSEASSPLGTEASANGKFEEVGDKIRVGGGGAVLYVFYRPWRNIDSRVSSGFLCGVKLKHRHERSTCFSLRRSI